MKSRGAQPTFAQGWTLAIRGISVAAIALATLGPALPTAVLAGVVAIGMLLIGLPHGALDLVLVARAGLTGWRQALVAYVGLVALSVAAFRLTPTLGLGLFLLASVWHFGKADAWRLGGLSATWAVSRGAVVVGGLLLADPATVSGVLVDLQADLVLPSPALAHRLLAVLLAVHLGISAAQPRPLGVIVEALVLGALLAVLQPTAFFGLYFLVWHSAPHLHRVVESLHEAVPRRTLLAAGLAWTVASVGVGAAAWSLLAGSTAHPTTPLIILSIAVTLPHLLVVEWGMEAPAGQVRPA